MASLRDEAAIYNGDLVSVVQWIERPPPKGQIQVRFLSGAPRNCTLSCYRLSMALKPDIPREFQALQWYPLGISPEVELLRHYVADIEAQVVRGIADYRKGTEYHEHPNPFDPEGTELIPHYGDIDGYMWDLNSVFAEYFPNLQRGSAAVTLFAFFENEMNRLCLLLQEVEAAKVGPKDLYGDGIERSTNYLNLIVGIDPNKNTPEWTTILGIREFRNTWVHAAGRLPPLPLDQVRQSRIFKFVESTDFLKLVGLNISIEPGFIAHVLQTFDRYFQLIHGSLEAKYKPKPAPP